MPPSRSYVSKINKGARKGTKLLKERCTLMVGGNADGHKLKPFLLHKYQKPHCLKGVERSTLPVSFRHNKKAWMTTASFRDYYVNFLLPELRKYCEKENIPFKILLLVDNAPSHPDLSDIDPNVKMLFLPPNTTSLIQPMDMGVISILKTNYKYLLLKKAIAAAEGTNIEFLQFLKKINIKIAIDLVAQAWDEVPTSAMSGVWKKLLKNEEDPESKLIEDKKVNDIVKIGSDFGIQEKFDSEAVRDGVHLEEDDLTIEELISMDEPEETPTIVDQNENDITEIEIVQEPVRKLKAETIDKALQQIREACDVLESDPNIEQFLAFKQHILAGTSIYKNCLMEKAKKKKQQKLLEFYETE